MQVLNLPSCELTIRESSGKKEVFDFIRKQYVTLTPEEWVRQHFVHYLIQDRNIPAGLIGVERTIKVNRMTKRCDIIVFDRKGEPKMMVEVKKPEIRIGKETFNQAIRYNLSLHINFLVLTNGLEHFCFFMDYQQYNARPIAYVPYFEELNQ